jgi:hypothetical protein
MLSHCLMKVSDVQWEAAYYCRAWKSAYCHSLEGPVLAWVLYWYRQLPPHSNVEQIQQNIIPNHEWMPFHLHYRSDIGLLSTRIK